MLKNEYYFDSLSDRENQVLDHLLLGKSNKNIAKEMHVCERTIKFHCSNIYKKLNVNSRHLLIIKINEKLYQGTGDNDLNKADN